MNTEELAKWWPTDPDAAIDWANMPRDPENGYIVGPDGCHYDDDDFDGLANLLLNGILGFCGCGMPDDAAKYVADGLRHIDFRMAAKDSGRKERDAHWKLVQEDERRMYPTYGAAYFFWYWADEAGLIEHGSSVPGWLSPRGRSILNRIDELLAKEAAA